MSIFTEKLNRAIDRIVTAKITDNATLGFEQMLFYNRLDDGWGGSSRWAVVTKSSKGKKTIAQYRSKDLPTRLKHNRELTMTEVTNLLIRHPKWELIHE